MAACPMTWMGSGIVDVLIPPSSKGFVREEEGKGWRLRRVLTQSSPPSPEVVVIEQATSGLMEQCGVCVEGQC